MSASPVRRGPFVEGRPVGQHGQRAGLTGSMTAGSPTREPLGSPPSRPRTDRVGTAPARHRTRRLAVRRVVQRHVRPAGRIVDDGRGHAREARGPALRHVQHQGRVVLPGRVRHVRRHQARHRAHAQGARCPGVHPVRRRSVRTRLRHRLPLRPRRSTCAGR